MNDPFLGSQRQSTGPIRRHLLSRSTSPGFRERIADEVRHVRHEEPNLTEIIGLSEGCVEDGPFDRTWPEKRHFRGACFKRRTGSNEDESRFVKGARWQDG